MDKITNQNSQLMDKITNQSSQLADEITNQDSQFIDEITNKSSKLVNEITNQRSQLVDELFYNQQLTVYFSTVSFTHSGRSRAHIISIITGLKIIYCQMVCINICPFIF